MFYVMILFLILSAGQSLAIHAQDNCAQALSLAIPSSGVANTTGATTDAPPACNEAAPQNGIWFAVVGNGTTLRFSTCDNDGSGDHALQVFKGDCSNLICVGGNDATFCHINTSSADATWCSEPGVTYYIHLGAETAGFIEAYYWLISLGACNYVGGNCVPEVVFAPTDFSGTTDNRDDCCFSDGADQHFLVYLPYASTWKFLICGGGSQPHQYIGTAFCSNDICEASDNLNEEEPGCFYGSRCNCSQLGPGYVHVTVETYFDDGIGLDYQYRIRDCNTNNSPNPIDLDPFDVSSSCELVFFGGYRIIRVFGPDLNPSRPPIVSVSEGCETCETNLAPPASALYDPNGWVLHPGSPNIIGQQVPYWQNVILGQGQGQGAGYVCVRLEGFLPVELLSFSAQARDGEVLLSWATGSESDVESFEIERDGAQMARIAATNSPTGSLYAYADSDVQNGHTYHYSLYEVAIDGERSWLADAEATPRANPEIVEEFALLQNYPNPFNPETTIEFSINEPGLVKLAVYDLSGREMIVLVDGSTGEGVHAVKLDASLMPSGIYFYRLERNGLSQTRKMVLLK